MAKGMGIELNHQQVSLSFIFTPNKLTADSVFEG